MRPLTLISITVTSLVAPSLSIVGGVEASRRATSRPAHAMVYPPRMDDVADLSCPYCGETLSWYFEQEVEGVLVQDCDVCCRPIQVELARDWEGERIVRTTRAQ